MPNKEFKFSGVEGVIQHNRPTACPKAGKEVEPIVVRVGAEGSAKAYQATCPECGKTLWLNRRVADDGVSLVFHFPEHIGKTADA